MESRTLQVVDGFFSLMPFTGLDCTGPLENKKLLVTCVPRQTDRLDENTATNPPCNSPIGLRTTALHYLRHLSIHLGQQSSEPHRSLPPQRKWLANRP